MIAYFLFQIRIQRGQLINILLFSSTSKTKHLNLFFSVIRFQTAHTYLLHKIDIKCRTYYMLWNFVIIISLLVAFLTLAHVLPGDSIFLLKHVGIMPLLFICIWYCALGWFNKRKHWSGIQGMDNFKINVTRGSVYVFSNSNCVSVPDSSSQLQRCGSLIHVSTLPFCIQLRKNGPCVAIRLYCRTYYLCVQYGRATVQLSAASRVY